MYCWSKTTADVLFTDSCPHYLENALHFGDGRFTAYPCLLLSPLCGYCLCSSLNTCRLAANLALIRLTRIIHSLCSDVWKFRSTLPAAMRDTHSIRDMKGLCIKHQSFLISQGERFPDQNLHMTNLSDVFLVAWLLILLVSSTRITICQSSLLRL